MTDKTRQILDMVLKKKKSIDQTARFFRVPKNVVQLCFYRHKIEIPAWGYMSKNRSAQAIILIQNGMTLDEAAAHMEIAVASIRAYARKAGIVLAKRKPIPRRTRRIVELGRVMAPDVLAVQFNTSYENVKRMLRKHGVTPLPKANKRSSPLDKDEIVRLAQEHGPTRAAQMTLVSRQTIYDVLKERGVRLNRSK